LWVEGVVCPLPRVKTRGYNISPLSGLFHRLDKCEMKKFMDFDGL